MALNNVPVSLQSLNASKPLINQNFLTINAAFLIDHVEYNLPDQGKHKQVMFTQQAADPATGVTEGAIYAKVGTGGVNNLFYRPYSSGTPVEFTYANKANPGYAWLPSGLLIQWVTAGIAGANATVALPIAFPTAHLYCQVSAGTYTGGNERDYIVGCTPAGLASVTVTRHPSWAGTGINVNVLAIGY